MDPGWQFTEQSVTGAQALAFSDTGTGTDPTKGWVTVGTPHSWNDVDSYRQLIDHSGGDRGIKSGTYWYRKHFQLPSTLSGSKVIVEFERIRQSATFYINGTSVGTYADGVTPCGIDVSSNVTFGAADNVLAVQVSNVSNGYYWGANATNPNHGGLVGHVWLHVPGKIYQTYPLYNNLQTKGIYVYGSNYANLTPSKGDLTVNVQAEVSNESGAAASATLGVSVNDPITGQSVTTFQGTATPLPTTGVTALLASGPMTGANLWSDVTPNLYNVITTISVGGKVVDSRTTTTGFRKLELRGGAGTGGIWINGRFVYGLGFAQRSTNEWAALGQGVPDWMHDYTTNLIKAANSNYIRWMHVAPQLVDVESFDRYGVLNIAPAGDKEVSLPTPAQWMPRMAVMQAEMIYLRNHPSIIGWEAGNSPVSGAQMQELAALKMQLDPNNGTGVGDRDMNDATGLPSADWFETMIGYNPPASDGSGYYRGYSDAYRDKGPVLEAEDFRDEAWRGYWDTSTPPYTNFAFGALDTYNETSESFTTLQVDRLNGWLNVDTIRNTTPANSKYSAYASIYFSDSDADGREMSSCVCRVSGKVDAVRLPKEIYYAFRVAGNTQPDIHVVGHWTYPAGTKKTVYVLANHVSSVELFVNGTSQGASSKPTSGYLYSFPNIAWATGNIKAVGYDASKTQVCSHTIQTAGPATAIKLTPTVDPNGGLKANGYDVAMFDVEVVDANGVRRPDDQARIDFTMTGPGIWRGGVNECIPALMPSTNNLYLDTEAGINRVFVRSTLAAGDISVTATRTGLASATAKVTAAAVKVTNGLTQ